MQKNLINLIGLLYKQADKKTFSPFLDLTRSSHRPVLGDLEKCLFHVNWTSYYIIHFFARDFVNYLTLNMTSIRINFCDLGFYSIKIKYINYP